MKIIIDHKYKLGIYIATIIFIYLAIVVVKAKQDVNQSVGHDELHWLMVAKNLFIEGKPISHDPGRSLGLWSPHLYPQLMNFSFHTFGLSLFSARLIGIASWTILLSIMISFYLKQSITESVSNEDNTIPILLFISWVVSIPLFFQAPLIVEIDNSVLCLSIFMMVLSVHFFLQSGTFLSAFYTTIFTCVAFWSKITTPLIIIPMLLLFSFFIRVSMRRRFALFACLILGVILFLMTWIGYCRLTGINDSWGPFNYTYNSFFQCSSGNRAQGLFRLAQTCTYFSLWIGIPTLIIISFFPFVYAKYLYEHRRTELWELFLFIGYYLILGYMLIGGSLFGFPKYQSPGIPLLCLGIAIYLTRNISSVIISKKELLAMVSLIIVAFLVQFLIIQDPIYTFRITLRESAIFDPISKKNIYLNVGIRVITGIIILGIFFFAYSRKANSTIKLCFALSIAIGANLSLCCVQLFSGYNTGYNYGERGEIISLVKELKDKVPIGKRIIAPSEIIYLLDRKDSPYMLDIVLWRDMNQFTEIILTTKAPAVIVGTLTNEISLVQNIMNEFSNNVLLKEYRYQKIGSFLVWTHNVSLNDSLTNDSKYTE